MATDPKQRPGFVEVVSELQGLSAQPEEIMDNAKIGNSCIVAPVNYIQGMAGQHPVCAA